MIDFAKRDPAKLAAATRLPMLIVQGETDIQVSTADAKLLADRIRAAAAAGATA